jgi:hypothetical protein
VQERALHDVNDGTPHRTLGLLKDARLQVLMKNLHIKALTSGKALIQLTYHKSSRVAAACCRLDLV